jgi:putative nucleotidyltransferase with HDIG domain
MNRRETLLLAGRIGLLVFACAAAVATTETADWKPWSLFASLLALTVVAQFLSVRVGSVQLGPAFVPTALAMALLGPAPAAVIAAAALLAWSLKAGTPWALLFDNLVAVTTYTVAGGLLFAALGDPGHRDTAEASTALIVFGVYLVTNLLNFLLIVGYVRLRDRGTVGTALRRIYLPALPWEAVGGALTAATVLGYQEIGLPAIALLAIVLVSFALLLRAAFLARAQRDELRERVGDLEALHHGVIRVMVEALGMRDRMTARHSAAVARYAKATAAAMKLSAREQELVHTAGLLHDVGKFTFPDHTLTGARLTEDDWELIRSHPQRGADIVGTVDGYAEVAHIILRQHERIDGHGYPHNVTGDDIPLLARVLAVADCFDVMTARDSYRAPISFEAAFTELRRVAGTQLDATVVEVFIDLLHGAVADVEQADGGGPDAELRRQASRTAVARAAHH